MIIETKFNINDSAFIITNNSVRKLLVKGIEYKNGRITYALLRFTDDIIYEEEYRCFATYEDLMEYHRPNEL